MNKFCYQQFRDYNDPHCLCSISMCSMSLSAVRWKSCWANIKVKEKQKPENLIFFHLASMSASAVW